MNGIRWSWDMQLFTHTPFLRKVVVYIAQIYAHTRQDRKNVPQLSFFPIPKILFGNISCGTNFALE